MGFASFVGQRTGKDDAKAVDPTTAGLTGAALNSYLLYSAKPTFDIESQFKRKYTGLDLGLNSGALFGTQGQAGLLDQYAKANTATRAADIADAQALSPNAWMAYRGANPDATALSDRLNESARTQLDMGSQLAPTDAYRITSGVRGDWSNRGLGASAPAGLDEALQLAIGGEGLRQSRQQFAGSVQSMNEADTANILPWLRSNNGQYATDAAGKLAAGAGPTLYNSNQMLELLKVPYGELSANSRATAANSTAAHSNINDNATSAFTSSA